MKKLFLFRFSLFCSLAFVLTLGCSAWSDEGADGAGSLRDYAVATAGRQAYGLYFQKYKVGWMVIESKLEDRGSGSAKKQVAVSRMDMMISMGRGGTGMRSQTTSATYYDLDDGGALIYAEQLSQEHGVKTKYTARPVAGMKDTTQPEKLTVVTQRGGREIARRAATTMDSLQSSKELQDWIISKPAADSHHQWSSFDLESATDTKQDFVFQNSHSISWGGVSTEIYSVKAVAKGMTVHMDVKANGWPISGRFGRFIDLRAEKEKFAKVLSGKQFDLLSASLIRADKDLGEPSKVETLRLELTGLEDFMMPASPRQKVISNENNKMILETRRDFRQEQATPLSETEKEDFLKSTKSYPLTPEIKDLAKKITGAQSDPVKKAGLLEKWVYVNVRPSMSANAATASEVLQARAGDCTEHTILFVALARAVGVPAREVGGIMYAGNGDAPIFGWHAWAQIHDGRQWVSIDPTWNEVWVDATHIQFSQGEDDWAWLDVLGSLQLKVASFQAG